jgi:hypothetical protein
MLNNDFGLNGMGSQNGGCCHFDFSLINFVLTLFRKPICACETFSAIEPGSCASVVRDSREIYKEIKTGRGNVEKTANADQSRY